MILLVDDTPSNIDILIAILGENFEISVALSGEDALEIMDEEKPDLVFLDVMMPEMDGYEVLESMKGRPELKDIPVVFLSGNTDAGEKQKGLDLGAVDYLTKPIDGEAVLERARRFDTAGSL